MRLSIIIPVYNVEPYLSQCIQSVLAQTWKDFELILVNDGSTDRSGEICDAFGAMDRRVRVIHLKNAGVSVARNTGVAAAQGDYIGFVDSDDIIERDMYAVMLAWAEAFDAEIVQCQHDRADALNGLARMEEVALLDGRDFVRRMFTKSGGQYTNQVSLCSKIIRRELFSDVVFPPGQVYEDEQETYKLCLKANKIVETQDILYHYIKRENSIITGIAPRKMVDKQKALLDRLHYLPARMPELEKECCRVFLGYTSGILCELYKAKETQWLSVALGLLLPEKKRLQPWMNKYERLYFLALRWKVTRAFVLKNDFMPIQKILGKLRDIGKDKAE